MPASEAYDVVVIGAGAGGMTAAAVAAAEGLRVLVIEKTELVGGTTAWSGGMVWIPGNAQMKQAGLSDSPSEAASYLAATVPESENADLRKTFLARGPEAVEYLEAHTEVRLQPVKTYPDYYPEQPGSTAGGACRSCTGSTSATGSPAAHGSPLQTASFCWTTASPRSRSRRSGGPRWHSSNGPGTPWGRGWSLV